MRGGRGFFNLLGLTLVLNEATGTEPPPLASLLLCGNAPLTVQRLVSERPSVLGFVYSVQRGGAAADVSQILQGQQETYGCIFSLCDQS